MEAIWVIDFQLPPGEFWDSDATEFRRYYEAWEERENREYLRSGVIASILMNANRDAKKKPQPFEPHDVFPHLKPDESTPVSPAEAHAAFRKAAKEAPRG